MQYLANLYDDVGFCSSIYYIVCLLSCYLKNLTIISISINFNKTHGILNG